MRRVLIVSPHFPPVNAADHQRVRHVLGHLPALGWEPTVLAIDPRDVAGAVLDPLLLETIPTGVRVERVRAVPLAVARWAGMSTLGLRAFPACWHAGTRLLKEKPFDLVFFSTTQFTVCALGPRWRQKLGVPYVLDFQDPWLSDYSHRGAPPGGWKYRFSRWQAAQLEPRAVRRAARIVAVSPRYLEQLAKRYGPEIARRGHVLPFATSERDFEVARSLPGTPASVPEIDRFVYVGRGGADMEPAARLLFRGLAAYLERHPDKRPRTRLEFIGTSYAPPEKAVPSIAPLAEAFGLGDCVSERPGRIPYFEALRHLLDARGILLLGSDDPGYSASKIHPCLLAARPLLALTHLDSPATQLVAEVAPECVATFAGAGAGPDASERVARWFESPQAPRAEAWRGRVRTDRTMAGELAEVFSAACSDRAA